jgi:arylsulfatase A-like enzyme
MNRFKVQVFPPAILPMSMIRRLAWAVWLTAWLTVWSTVCLTTSALAGSVPAPPISSHPNIILITLDTTRADRMGFQGSKLGLTPNLDALALDSAVFTRAYAQAPLTPTSHASILTGTYPQFHQVTDFQRPLAEDLPYAPAILRSHGYRTAAFIGAIALNPDPTYSPGFDRGFDTYDAGFHKEGPGADRYHTVQRRGDEVVAHALAWLTKHPKGPFFIWIHLYDAHDPYDPPEPYKTRYASAPYDGAIAYEDAAVGKLLRQLKLRGLYDGTIMAVTADHGESLGAHGEDTHGIFLYDETIQVPLLIKLPHASAAGKRIENRVELVDILPTLLQEVQIEIPKEVQGESLLALIKAESNPAAEAWRDRAAYAQSDVPRIEFGWSAEQSLRTGKYLYIQAPRRELYDQTADPKADHDLASSSAAVADTLASQLETFQ